MSFIVMFVISPPCLRNCWWGVVYLLWHVTNLSIWLVDCHHVYHASPPLARPFNVLIVSLLSIFRLCRSCQSYWYFNAYCFVCSLYQITDLKICEIRWRVESLQTVWLSMVRIVLIMKIVLIFHGQINTEILILIRVVTVMT